MGWGQPKIHKPFFAENIVLRRGSPLLCRCFGQEIAWSLWEWEWEWYALHSRPLVSVQYTFLYFSFCKEYILKACCARCWELVGWGWVLQGRRLSALLPKYLPAVVIVYAEYKHLLLCKRMSSTYRNEREGLLDIVRHRLDIPHVGSWQNHCCQPCPMCSQHLATVFQLLNGRKL